MAKGKSSASSGTRKKHARKATAAHGPINEPPAPTEKKPKGKEKGSKRSKEPRKKVYIPPVKPAPVQPDPLDTLGIAQKIPPDLLVVLRRLAKKDFTTKRRALEDLKTGWVEKARMEDDEGPLVQALIDAIPVWFHHLPVLFTHPSRRIRLLAIGLHRNLLDLSGPISTQLLFYLSDVADVSQAESILSAWCMLAHDVDRQVSAYARLSWDKYVLVTQSSSSSSGSRLVIDWESFTRIWNFIHRTILDPGGVYLYLNPPQPAAPLPPRKAGTRALQTPKREEEQSRTKSEEEEESEADRKARLRIGAFGAAEWVLNTRTHLTQEPKDLETWISPLDNLAIWSSLHFAQVVPFLPSEIEGFGWNQPGVRKAAWSLLDCLLRVCKGHLQNLLPTLSNVVLRSAWVESDSTVRSIIRYSLWTFLTDYPVSWELEAAASTENDADADGDSDSDGDEDTQQVQKPSAVANALGVSRAYKEFLQYLELGCSGAPIQEYPAVFVILSTIPTSVMASVEAPLQTLFVSFWAAVDGRALSGLDRLSASKEFLSSLLESLEYMCRHVLDPQTARLLVSESPTQRPTVIQAFMAQQIGRIWDELCSKSLKVDDSAAASLLATTLHRLYRFDPDIFNACWNTLSTRMRSQLDAIGEPISSLTPFMLRTFKSQFANDLQPYEAARGLLAAIIHCIFTHFEAILQDGQISASNQTRLTSLVEFLDVFGRDVFGDEELSKDIDETINRNIGRILELSSKIPLTYLRHRGDLKLEEELWHQILNAIAEAKDPIPIFQSLLSAAEKRDLSDRLRPSGDELDEMCDRLLSDALTNAADTPLDLVKRLLKTSVPFISESSARALVSSISGTFSMHSKNVLYDDSISMSLFDPILELLSSIVGIPVLSETIALSVLPSIFTLAFIVPRFRLIDLNSQVNFRIQWRTWLSSTPEIIKTKVFSIIIETIRELLLDCSALISPKGMYVILTDDILGFEINAMEDIFPKKSELDAMLDLLPSTPVDTSLAVIDPLALQSFSDGESISEKTNLMDSSGYTVFVRVAIAMLLYLSEDRSAARSNIWILRHLHSLAQYSNDLLKVPFAENPVFASSISHETLGEIASKVQQLSAYLLSPTMEEGWLLNAVPLLSEGKAGLETDGILQLLGELIRDPRGKDSIREARVLHTLLQQILAIATKSEAEQFILLARRIEKTAPHAALAIIFSVTKYAPETQRLDRYRNELAASLLGIPGSRANTEGLWALRRLVAVAPDPESDIIFLPTPRAVNVMKACQQWITSDEDIDEEVESEMTMIFYYLAPILQNVAGAHWEFVYDVIENNLESCSLNDASTFVVLSRTLKLIISIQELSTTNKSLRSSWEERQTSILTLVRDLTARKLDSNIRSAPLSVCRELAISIVQDLPQSLIDHDTLSKMCHLVTDSSPVVQKMAYRMLHEAAVKRTEYIVVEAAMESEDHSTPELPAELVILLQQSLIEEGDTEHDSNIFGYLLGWMLTFDLFTNASLKVKSGYIEHLRRLDLISNHFLPHVLSILGLYDGIAKAFKLDMWAVDDYYLDLYSSQSSRSLPLLAAHLYYRALLIVSSLFRSWLLDCRDRQLSNTITTYTSNHFSPAIIRAELDQVKDPEATTDLNDENLKIKVATNVNEVTASYAVDDDKLELRVKIPSDWPLHTIEIQDTNIVGVPEKRYRSWVLGVQQIITFRSGSIIDGIVFWKKNVTSYFEGKSPCAICYSIFSATDGSIPSKPCRTCENRFHAVCLYKWFKSSHSSSCPLCRSNIGPS